MTTPPPTSRTPTLAAVPSDPGGASHAIPGPKGTGTASPAAVDAVASGASWADDTPHHRLLSRHPAAPVIETRVSKVMAKPMAEVFQHFWGSDPRLRLELHRDHVKGYNIHKETPDSLEYEFVFEAYGTRNWGKAVEVASRGSLATQSATPTATRAAEAATYASEAATYASEAATGAAPPTPTAGTTPRIDVEVLDGPLKGQTVTTLFRAVPGGTEVTQVNRVWPGNANTVVKIMGNRLKARLIALAGVHLEQHRHDLEGLERFQDRFSIEHQAKLAASHTNPVVDFLKTTRAIALPAVVLPLLGAAALASSQGTFDGLALLLTLVGGGAALLAGNLLNDVYDFKQGADQSARSVPGAIETGSGAFVEGRWSLRKGWAVTAALAAVALACGLVLAWLSTPLVLAFAVAGAVVAYTYIGPPFPLAYKGRGLGELSIFAAFGPLPVLGGVLAHGGTVTAQAWWVASVFGLTSVLLLYHHHFLHWEADRAAGKLSPVALLGPRKGAVVGAGIALATSLAIALPPLMFPAWDLSPWLLLPALFPLLALPAQVRVAAGAVDPPARTRIASAAFGAMFLTGLATLLIVWLA